MDLRKCFSCRLGRRCCHTLLPQDRIYSHSFEHATIVSISPAPTVVHYNLCIGTFRDSALNLFGTLLELACIFFGTCLNVCWTLLELLSTLSKPFWILPGMLLGTDCWLDWISCWICRERVTYCTCWEPCRSLFWDWLRTVLVPCGTLLEPYVRP